MGLLYIFNRKECFGINAVFDEDLQSDICHFGKKM
jgi:hypothetical protein